jgi:hypothetical protein
LRIAACSSDPENQISKNFGQMGPIIDWKAIPER